METIPQNIKAFVISENALFEYLSLKNRDLKDEGLIVSDRYVDENTKLSMLIIERV